MFAPEHYFFVDSAQGRDLAPFVLEIGAKVKNFLRLSHL